MQRIKNNLKLSLKKLPFLYNFLRDIYNPRLHSANNLQDKTSFNDGGYAPPGHFYSPIPSIAEVKKNEIAIWGNISRSLAGIDLNETGQLHLLNDLTKFYEELPFGGPRKFGLRYYFENLNFSYADAISLFCIIRHLKPTQIIEVGSGFSSCVILDTNQCFFENKIRTIFIEPFPETFLSLIKEEDRDVINLISKNLQEVSLETFCSLGENDILFIDSTHVSKIRSDVNYIFFDLLPKLNKGVYVHFHDIFYPFEYPKEWIYEGRAWNEVYLLRAFLQFNDYFEIVFFNDFLATYYRDLLERDMPLFLRNTGGSIWLRKKK
jgi:hypothetical protein